MPLSVLKLARLAGCVPINPGSEAEHKSYRPMLPNTFLHRGARRNPGLLCLEYCLVLRRVNKFVNKNNRVFPVVLLGGM